MRRTNKKGQLVIDIFTVLIILFVVSITFIIGYRALKEINDDFQLDPDFTVESKANLQQTTTAYPVFMDNAFLIMVILFWIILIVTTLFIDSNPIFFIVSVVLLIIVFVVGMIMSNAYDDVFSDGDLITFADAFPKINFIMDNLALVLIIMGLTASLSLYAKNSTGGIA